MQISVKGAEGKVRMLRAYVLKFLKLITEVPKDLEHISRKFEVIENQHKSKPEIETLINSKNQVEN